jgi:hypothetical protein
MDDNMRAAKAIAAAKAKDKAMKAAAKAKASTKGGKPLTSK